MKIKKDIWLARDANTGDWNAFTEEPTQYGFNQFWISNSGHITPMRLYASELNEYCKTHKIEEINDTTIKATITLELESNKRVDSK